MDNIVWKYSLPAHTEIKDQLLDLINEYEQINPCKDPVIKSDFYDDICFNPAENEYYSIFHQVANETLYRELAKHYCIKDFGVLNVWFQQYINGSYHGWHLHANSNISISYLLELPDKKYSTEFLDTTTKSKFQLDVEEGDVIIFPSHVIHRSPVISSDVRKTTIAINLSLGNPDWDLIKSDHE